MQKKKGIDIEHNEQNLKFPLCLPACFLTYPCVFPTAHHNLELIYPMYWRLLSHLDHSSERLNRFLFIDWLLSKHFVFIQRSWTCSVLSPIQYAVKNGHFIFFDVLYPKFRQCFCTFCQNSQSHFCCHWHLSFQNQF